MITRKALPRRTFLKGVGTAIALPFLDAMSPAMAASSAPTKVRMAFVYVPNGIIMNNWNPDYEGKLTQPLPRTLKAMEPFKDDMLLMGNLTHNTGRALLDGAGDHGRCCGSYLTGVQVKKSTSDIRASVSMDQLVANQIGSQTRFPSLELGLEDARQSGDCDSGYSCAYTNNLAWRSETQPLPPILDPRALFERLFGNGVVLSPEARQRQSHLPPQHSGLRHRRHTQAGRRPGTHRPPQAGRVPLVDPRSGAPDRARREGQQQIDPHMEKPYGVPADFAEHFKLMTDMMTIAFQADLTRVITFLVTHEGTSRAYREIGISDGHHPLTHHRNQADLMEKVAQINELPHAAVRRVDRQDEVDQGRRPQPAGQLDDRLRRGPFRRQPPPARGSAHADRGPRRQLHQDRPPRGLPQRDAHVQSVPHHDGPHGRATWSISATRQGGWKAWT